MFEQEMQEETQLRQPASPMKGAKKGKKGDRAQTATSPSKRSMTSSTVVTTQKISRVYEQRGYTESQVELDHLRTVETEVKRERGVNESLQADNQMLREQLSRANERINGLESVRTQQAENIREQQTFITKLEQVREEQTSHIDLLVQENHALKSENESLLDDKEQLQKEVQAASDYILQLEEKCFMANKTSLELLQQVRDLEAEVETLKAYIIDLKSRIAVYIPVKQDAIDTKLAEYINNYPDRKKLKIMFMRESEGVYEFGSRRVMVKVERGKIQIKVGGGFLSIDEFLDQYTPVELERLERNDPLKRFSERVAVQKVLGDKAGVETSPVRGRDPSPGKASPVKKKKQAI